MVRLREIPRTATFAWSPGSGLPLIATGTRAGAVDADFSDDTSLELWNLNLGDPDHGVEVQPAASISTDSRFHDIAWGRITNDHRWGVIAGALENGALDLWDADALLKGSKDSFMSRTTKHSGAIKSLQFNPFKPELLATAGAKGELFISDLNNVANPFRLGNSAARADDFEAVDWNKKVPHILATGSSGGFVTVWDVRAKKENLTLHNMGRKAVSAVAWDPEQSTKLITAIPDDTSPLILVWDLRNSQAPERTLKAHEGGVLSLSWCQQDTNLLLSCGKDNRTICWNPRTGQPYGEFPVVTNWTFQTRWNPHNPSLLATASFDGKIAVQTIQNTNGKDSTAGSHRPKLDGEAFFDNAQTQPQEATFSLPVPPKWLERPVGVSFGFGGKVVSFGPEDTTAGSTSRKSKIRISQFEVDSSVGNATETFEKALQQGDLASICQSKISSAKSDEEKADWSVIETLIASDPKSKLLSYIGFSQAVDTAADGMGKLGFNDEDQKFDGSPETDKQVNGAAKSNRLSSFFDNKDDGDSFLSDLAATKGAKTNNPFEIYTGSETAPDKQITKALLVGRFEEALDICLKEQRMSDAFMIAICGGQSCIEKAKAAYFTKKAHGPNYLRLLASVSGKNLWDVVHNANLKDWKEAMAMFCTFAEPKEFPDLCEALGDRLEEELKGKTSQANLRKDASLCYMAGSKLESVVKIWVEELKESEESFQDTTGDSAFSIHARSLQNLIEKVTVFRAVTKFQDTERTQSSGWKLAPLYDKYAEYADVVAAHGQLEVAEKYLDLLPPNYPAAEVARNRVKQASRKATPAATARQTATATRTGARTQPAMPGYPSMQAPQTSATPANPYSISGGAAQPPNPYGAPASNAYAPQGYQAQQSQGYNQGQAPQMYGGFQQQQQPPQKVGVPPPPRNTTASPAMPPASKRTDIPNWNDTPLVTKPPTSRRGTPGLGPAPITSPFPNQNNQPLASPPPTGAPFNMQQRATPPVAPPPKGSAPPRVSSPLVSGFQQNTFQQPERPPSAALNAYAPAPSSNQLGNVAPSIPRGASPYNAPPSAPPASNRYAPAAAPQDSTSSMQQPGSIAPPPQGGARPGPPPNPYAPQQSQFGSHTGQSSYPGTAPPPNFSQGTPSGLPQRAPPPLSRPGTAQSGSTPTAAAAVAPPAPPKYPAGDRSHLSPEGQSIYEILNGDMQRVKSRAPASFKAQVNDAEKRLNILFDHLNNDDLLKPDTVTSVVELAQALQRRDYAEAQAIQQEIHTKKTDECGSWMVGVNRLIRMSKATP